MKKALIICILSLMFLSLKGQELISIDSCYKRLERNYPEMQNIQLISDAVEIQHQLLKTNYLPKLRLGAQATWQSEVTQLSIDNPMFQFETPEISKDQYKAYAEITQTIWDGGMTSVSKAIEELSGEIEHQEINLSIHQIKQQINELYFTILLLQEQYNILEYNKASINKKHNEIQVAVENDMALSADSKELEVAILDIRQEIIKTESARKTCIVMMEVLTGESIPELADFLLPGRGIQIDTLINRPELDIMDLQKQQIQQQKQQASALKHPMVSAFAQGGYGLPGLNMLSNDFDPYAIVGIRLSWNIWEWNKLKKQHAIADINLQKIDNKKHAFVNNINAQAESYLQEIKTQSDLMSQAEEIIVLREEIQASKEAQLNEGNISVSDYLEALYKASIAKVQLEIHKINKAKAVINYLTLTGKIENK